MNEAVIEKGSFRDPAGYIYQANNTIYRAVMPVALADYQFVRQTGLIEELIAEEKLVAEAEVANTIDENAAIILQHPKLAFISYPYEWCFSALKAAALMQLDIHLQALNYDVTLSDASSYNMQFVGAKPIFIDHLSFVKYEPGDIWWGHRQFCQHYLNPLLLQSACHLDFQAWLRSSLDGIAATDLARILPWHKKYLSYNVFMHVLLQAKLQSKALGNKTITPKKAHMPKTSLESILQSLRNFIAKLKTSESINTTWQDYTKEHNYTDIALQHKEALITEFAAKTKPKLLWDIGCNTGHFSLLALKAGAKQVIGFDVDTKVVDMAFNYAQNENLNFLPLYLNLANPSPDQGFAGCERKCLAERGPADGIIALALLHHLVIAENIPMHRAISYLISLAPEGIIEFVAKEDSQVQKLLRTRKDIFPDYTFESFKAIIKSQANIVKEIKIPESERCLLWYKVQD